MPELPEVETARRTLQRVLVGHKIVSAEAPDDHIVLSGLSGHDVEKALVGAEVTGIGRRGKYWWIDLDRKPCVMGHLGMAGWIRELGAPSIRLREHGQAPFEDEQGRPRFLKLMLKTDEGKRVVFTDGRRLGRLWLGDPATDERIQALGPDMLESPPSAAELHRILSARKAPIKALLLDQALFAGVGNWIADETLYQSGISPKRPGSSLSLMEVERLRKALLGILQTAVDVGADSEKYPKDWLFMHRWGGKNGVEEIGGKAIVRERVGGRTTAWVPSKQK